MAVKSLDTDQARTTASVFDACRDSIGQSEFGRLMSSVNDVSAQWSGGSRTQFENEWSNWSNQLQALMLELERLAGGLRREADEFDQADQAFGG
ncbi:MAG: WXG100 family type VII secretion target, partial [Chloroflexota bacterium]|nr:WXG100 family type VII secretion target [Chloroflexota bacterium]PLS76882.1 MAG: WXG100 family type VII secretion target [Chloroflexota bacterium]